VNKQNSKFNLSSEKRTWKQRGFFEGGLAWMWVNDKLPSLERKGGGGGCGWHSSAAKHRILR